MVGGAQVKFPLASAKPGQSTPTLGRNIPIDVIQFTVADRLRELFFGSR